MFRFLLAITSFSFVNSVFGDENGDAFVSDVKEFKATRHLVFDQCHLVMTNQNKLRKDSIALKREIWTKNGKIRVDSIYDRGRDISIVDGNTYIAANAGIELVRVGDTAVYEDVYRHLGILSPIAIGDTNQTTGGYSDDKDSWICELISRKLKSSTAERVVSGQVVTYVISSEPNIPINMSKEQKELFTRQPEDLFRAYPEIKRSLSKVVHEIAFDRSHQNQLARRITQQTTEGQPVIVVSSEITYASLESSVLSYPKKVEIKIRSDERETESRLITIDLIEVGDVDDLVLTVEGLSLPDGTPVGQFSANGPPRLAIVKDGKVSF
jgi:hypothetical protein